MTAPKRWILLCCITVALCDPGSDPWTDVASTTQYNSLQDCAKGCLLNVNTLTNCEDLSCVCSEDDSRGTNYKLSFTNISACALQSCQDQGKANQAVFAFRDICATVTGQGYLSATTTSSQQATISTDLAVANTSVTSASVTNANVTVSPTALPSSPTQTETTQTSGTATSYILLITSTSYPSLNPCSKFCLNSCRNVNGVVNEADCSINKQPAGWELYRGLADQLGCSNFGPSCICAGNSFFISFGQLYNASVVFCNYLPTVSNEDSPDYDSLQGVLADYCAANGWTPDGYFMTISGDKDTSGSLESDPSALSTADKVGIAIGVGSFFATALGTWFAWVMLRKKR